MTATEKNVLNVVWLYNQTPEAGGDRNTLKMLRLAGLEAGTKRLCGRKLAASHLWAAFSTCPALYYITEPYHPTRSLLYFGNNSKHCRQQKFGIRFFFFWLSSEVFSQKSGLGRMEFSLTGTGFSTLPCFCDRRSWECRSPLHAGALDHQNQEEREGLGSGHWVRDVLDKVKCLLVHQGMFTWKTRSLP